MVSTPEIFIDNSTMSPGPTIIVKNCSARKSLRLFIEMLGVKNKTSVSLNDTCWSSYQEKNNTRPWKSKRAFGALRVIPDETCLSLSILTLAELSETRIVTRCDIAMNFSRPFFINTISLISCQAREKLINRINHEASHVGKCWYPQRRGRKFNVILCCYFSQKEGRWGKGLTRSYGWL